MTHTTVDVIILTLLVLSFVLGAFHTSWTKRLDRRINLLERRQPPYTLEELDGPSWHPEKE